MMNCTIHTFIIGEISKVGGGGATCSQEGVYLITPTDRNPACTCT